MLFDLRSGRRRRVVQVVYSLLAASFLIGFVIFGVGTGGIGSISDIFSGGGGGSASSAFDSQIEQAQKKLKKDPKDQQALQQLATNEYSAGQADISQDSSTGQITISDDARSHFSAAVDAWSRYLKVAKNPSPALASQIAQAYAALNDPVGAARAQRVLAEAQPSTQSLAFLARYLYFAGNFKAGDAAADQALAKAVNGQQRRTAKGTLASWKRDARRYVKAQKAAAKASTAGGGAGAGNPFQGGLAPSSP